MHDFEEIEDAVIAALNPLLSGGLRTLATYSGELEVEELEEITFQFPCIYVIANGLTLGWANRYDKYEMGVTLIVGDRNVRGSAAAARGDASSPGVYELLLAARGKLHNKKLVPAWAPLVVIDEAPLVYAPEKSICLYTAEYRTKAVK